MTNSKHTGATPVFFQECINRNSSFLTESFDAPVDAQRVTVRSPVARACVCTDSNVPDPMPTHAFRVTSLLGFLPSALASMNAPCGCQQFHLCRSSPILILFDGSHLQVRVSHPTCHFVFWFRPSTCQRRVPPLRTHRCVRAHALQPLRPPQLHATMMRFVACLC